jgi:hypothetical protein
MYFLQMKCTWNKLKWKKLNIPIEDNSHVNGDFSYSYIIMCEYFDLMLET